MLRRWVSPFKPGLSVHPLTKWEWSSTSLFQESRIPGTPASGFAHSSQHNKPHLFQASLGFCPCPLSSTGGLPTASPNQKKKKNLLLRGLRWTCHHTGPLLPAPTLQSRDCPYYPPSAQRAPPLPFPQLHDSPFTQKSAHIKR